MSDDAQQDEDYDNDLLEGFDLDDETSLDDEIDNKPKNRFYCAGADHKDEDSGTKLCNHKAPNRWGPPCPKCSRWYDCLPIKGAQSQSSKEMTLADMDKVKEMQHHATGIEELDKIWGGGIVYGKVILFAGIQGGGKTRLLLQLATKFARPKRRVFFSSGEDERDAVIQFAQKLGLPKTDGVIVHGNPQGLIIDELVDRLRHQHVKLWIIDSAQTVGHSSSEADFRTVEQINKVCGFLGSMAKQAKIAIILIGQITTEGEMAGGGALKHGVDLLTRLDPYPLYEEDGTPVPGGENVRMLWVDGKSRQGRANIKTYLEMSNENGSLQPLSRQLQRKVAQLESTTP